MLFRSILAMPVKVAAASQAGALGGAVFAAAAAKLYPDVFQAMAAMHTRPDRVYEPDAGRSAVYGVLYQNYCRMADSER